MNANKVTFPVYAIILKTRVNPITQTWESKLRKDRRFGKETYPVWIYDLNDCITKIGYDIDDYNGHADIWVLENKNDLNNFWSFCERLQKKNPGWTIHLGLLPYESSKCPFSSGSCGKYQHEWENIAESCRCWEETEGDGKCSYESSLKPIMYTLYAPNAMFVGIRSFKGHNIPVFSNEGKQLWFNSLKELLEFLGDGWELTKCTEEYYHNFENDVHPTAEMFGILEEFFNADKEDDDYPIHPSDFDLMIGWR